MTKIKAPKALRPLMMPLAELEPDELNARKHSDRNIEAVMTSLQRFGWCKPLVAQRVAGRLVLRAGHGTLEAARRLNVTEAPVVVMTSRKVSEGQAYAVADNRTAELAEWDTPTLEAVLAGLPEEDLGAVGFTPDELAALLGSAPGGYDLDDLPPDPVEAPDAPVDAPERLVTVVLGPMSEEDWQAVKAVLPPGIPQQRKSQRVGDADG